MPGAILAAHLRVGQDFIGDPLPRSSALIKEFIVEDGGGRRPLVGREGADPAGLLRVAAPGLLVIGYHSEPSRVTQTAEKFTQYLAEEGLEAIVALRARLGQTGPVRELFSRCAKSLVLAGAPTAASGDRSLGFRLELVAERSPYALHAGETLPVRLAFEGRPLAGALVVAINHDRPAEKVSARTDSAGRVRLRLSQGGTWLVKAVHMIPAQPGADAEWESFWASLTFDLEGPAGVSSQPSR
jgi:hypothetical protein